MKKALLLTYLLLLGLASSFAQTNDCYKKVGFFASHSPKRLSYRLTHNLKTDSEKVCAIHAWITHKIKYDVKKWLSFDYSCPSAKKVLWKRKATCTGYSELFDVLCKYASVSSVTASGYVKDIHTDITDTFYVDEHTWNAVFTDGTWHLIDPCWDAGYIKFVKRTFWGFFVHLLSGGKADRVKYKPHFITAPTDFYFCKSGQFFKTDHLPLNPIWQLIAPAGSICDYRNDSSYYYKYYYLTLDPVNPYDEYESDRQAYLSADSNKRLSIDATQGYKFNFRNHWESGEYFSLIANSKMEAIDKKSRDTVQQLKACDTVMKYISKALSHLDSNNYYLLKQKAELKKTNELKRGIMSVQNEKLIKSTKEIISSFLTAKALAGMDIKFTRMLINSNKHKLELAKDNDAFYNKKHSKVYLPADSLYMDSLLHALTDTIGQREKSMRNNYAYLDSVYKVDCVNLHIYLDTTKIVLGLENEVISTRISFFDDLDYEVRSPKDTLIKIKGYGDSLLYIDGKFRVLDLLHRYRDMKKYIDALVAMYKLKIQLLKNFRGICVSNNTPDKEYLTNLDKWQATVDTISKLKIRWTERFKLLKQYCKINKKFTKEELDGGFWKGGGFYGEKKLEFYFFSRRNVFINQHSRAFQKISSRLDSKMNVLKSRILTYQQNLNKNKKS